MKNVFRIQVSLRKDKAYAAAGLYPLALYLKHLGKKHYIYTDYRVSEAAWLAKRGEAYDTVNKYKNELRGKIKEAIGKCIDKINFEIFRDLSHGRQVMVQKKSTN